MLTLTVESSHGFSPDIPFTFHLNQLYASAVQHDEQQQEMVSRLPENLNFFPMCTPDWFPTAKQN